MQPHFPGSYSVPQAAAPPFQSGFTSMPPVVTGGFHPQHYGAPVPSQKGPLLGSVRGPVPTGSGPFIGGVPRPQPVYSQPTVSQVAPAPQPIWAPPIVRPVAATPVIPPGAISSAAPPPASFGGDSEQFEFRVGDKVRLRGQAGNPAYEGRLYTVEVPDNGNGAVLVSHKLSETAVSRMTFNKAFLEFVEEASQEEATLEAEATAQAKAADPLESFKAAASGFEYGDKVVISGLDAYPKHNGRLAIVQMVDELKKCVRVKFEDSGNDMVELAPSYLELVEKAPKLPAAPADTNGTEDADPNGLRKGDKVRIIAPPQHRGKVAVVDAPDNGSGTLRVRLEEIVDSVVMLVVSPAHVEHMDGTPVKGTAAAIAATEAAAEALRQAAMPTVGGKK